VPNRRTPMCLRGAYVRIIGQIVRGAPTTWTAPPFP
jgi:hypothetical protein